MSYDFLKQALYQPSVSLPVLLTLLLVAFVLGILHALGPGHGKSLMAAYVPPDPAPLAETSYQLAPHHVPPFRSVEDYREWKRRHPN